MVVSPCMIDGVIKRGSVSYGERLEHERERVSNDIIGAGLASILCHEIESLSFHIVIVIVQDVSTRIRQSGR